MTSPEMQLPLTEVRQNALAITIGSGSVIPITRRKLSETKEQINSLTPQEKVIFLEKIFAILSNPDPTSQSQDRRDAVLDMLLVMDLTSINQEELKKTYVKAVFNLREGLNKDSDPYGEIHMLLEAGKTIAPFIGRRQGMGIATSWALIAKTFTGDDRQKILNDIEGIKKLLPRQVTEFDTNVAALLKNNMPNKDIARVLDVPETDVKRSIGRLIDKGLKPSNKRRQGPRRSEQMQQLFEDVRDFRNQGMGNLKIASLTGTSPSMIGNIASKLIAKGEIPRIYNSGPKKKVISS